MTARRALAAFVLALVPLAARAAEMRVVLLPLENLSRNDVAVRELAPAVAAALVTRGYVVAAGDEVDKALDERGVRYLDSLDEKTRSALLTGLHADAVAFGSLYVDEGGPEPILALSFRLVTTDGATLFSSIAGIAAIQTNHEGLFGEARAATREELVARTVERLTKGLPAPGASALPESRRKPLELAAPRTFRSASLPHRERRRVAVLPLANASSSLAAGRVVGELLFRRLAASPDLAPVEPAELREALLSTKVRDYGDPAELKRLGAHLGTTLFATGTVYKYDERRRTTPPSVELSLTVTDAASGEVVFSSFHGRKGSDYSGLLSLGEITNVVPLADQVLDEMVSAEAKAKATTNREKKP